MSFSRLSDDRRTRLRTLAANDRLRELFFFLLIGGTGAVLYTLMNWAFIRAGLQPSLAIAVTLAILIPPMYLSQARLTFRSAREHRYAFPRYAGTQLFGNAIAMVLARVFETEIRAHPLAASVIVAVMVAAMNYGFLKFWAFRRPPAPRTA